MTNQLQNIKLLLFSLKMNYGFAATVHIRGDSPVINYETGAQSLSTTSYSISRAILLPDEAFRDVSNLVAKAVLGARDVNKKVIIIDGADLSVTPQVEDYVDLDSNRYVIKEVNTLANNLGYMLSCQYAEGDTI